MLKYLSKIFATSFFMTKTTKNNFQPQMTRDLSNPEIEFMPTTEYTDYTALVL